MKIFIFRNSSPDSVRITQEISEIINKRNDELLNDFDESADLIICIGGDGTFLSCIHKCNFPRTPIVGINTGHLGFFQEMSANNINSILDEVTNGTFDTQIIKPVDAKIYTERDTYMRTGINEVLIRGPYSHVTQFTVSIGNTKIQDFSGDGILISTPVGSTAYNYSLGGSIVAPNLDVLQLTPVAPMNTNAYRCFHSSIILPSNDTITLEGIKRSKGGNILISFDGRTHEFNNVSKVEIVQSDKEIHLLRYNTYDYWEKLKSKLI